MKNKDSGTEYYHRILHGSDPAGKADRQRVLQGLRLHEHGTGRRLPFRFQARPLHEDPAQIHVPSSGSTLNNPTRSINLKCDTLSGATT